MEIVARPFAEQDFIAGHPVLDLANTVAGRDPARVPFAPGEAKGRDRLAEFRWAIAWAAARRELVPREPGEPELLSHVEQLALERMATREPARAAEELDRLRALREAIFDLVATRAQGGEVPARVLDSLVEHWKEASQHAILGSVSGQFSVTWTPEASGLALIRHRIAWQALALVTGEELDRVHPCAGDNCGWLFLDRSKAGRRRWCDMATCGNVAKARRHYQRRRGGAERS